MWILLCGSPVVPSTSLDKPFPGRHRPSRLAVTSASPALCTTPCTEYVPQRGWSPSSTSLPCTGLVSLRTLPLLIPRAGGRGASRLFRQPFVGGQASTRGRRAAQGTRSQGPRAQVSPLQLKKGAGGFWWGVWPALARCMRAPYVRRARLARALQRVRQLTFVGVGRWRQARAKFAKKNRSQTPPCTARSNCGSALWARASSALQRLTPATTRRCRRGAEMRAVARERDDMYMCPVP